LADGVGCALVPLRRLVGLLRRQDFHETPIERVELVRVRNMPMEADRQELRQDVDAVQFAVDAITDRDVDEAVLAGDGDGRLAAEFGQGIQPSAATAAEDQGKNILHEWPFYWSSSLVFALRSLGREAETCYHSDPSRKRMSEEMSPEEMSP